MKLLSIKVKRLFSSILAVHIDDLLKKTSLFWTDNSVSNKDFSNKYRVKLNSKGTMKWRGVHTIYRGLAGPEETS